MNEKPQEGAGATTGTSKLKESAPKSKKKKLVKVCLTAIPLSESSQPSFQKQKSAKHKNLSGSSSEEDDSDALVVVVCVGRKGNKSDWAFMQFTPRAAKDGEGKPVWAWACNWCKWVVILSFPTAAVLTSTQVSFGARPTWRAASTMQTKNLAIPIRAILSHTSVANSTPANTSQSVQCMRYGRAKDPLMENQEISSQDLQLSAWIIHLWGAWAHSAR